VVLAEGKGVGVTVRFLIAAAVAAAMIAAPPPARADIALILSGVPGSPEHETRFAEWSAATRDALTGEFGFAEEDVVLLENREARADDVRAAFADIGGRIGENETFFLFFIGHGAFDRGDYKFNIMGADLTAADYASMLDNLPAARTAIINGTSSSGASIEPLAAANRVIVTATRTGNERLDPLFYEYFLETLSAEAADEDRNERLSIWEVFRYTTLEIERFYEEQGRLATEHSQLSDNGGEQAGIEREREAVLARLINFNQVVPANIEDPVLAALYEERQALEAAVAELRLVEDVLPTSEFNDQLDELLINLALKNQEIREREAAGTEADTEDTGPEVQP